MHYMQAPILCYSKWHTFNYHYSYCFEKTPFYPLNLCGAGSVQFTCDPVLFGGMDPCFRLLWELMLRKFYVQVNKS